MPKLEQYTIETTDCLEASMNFSLTRMAEVKESTAIGVDMQYALPKDENIRKFAVYGEGAHNTKDAPLYVRVRMGIVVAYRGKEKISKSIVGFWLEHGGSQLVYSLVRAKLDEMMKTVTPAMPGGLPPDVEAYFAAAKGAGDS